MMSLKSPCMASKTTAVVSSSCVTTGIRIFSMSFGSRIWMWKCRETMSLDASVLATSTSSRMPKSVLWIARGHSMKSLTTMSPGMCRHWYSVRRSRVSSSRAHGSSVRRVSSSSTFISCQGISLIHTIGRRGLQVVELPPQARLLRVHRAGGHRGKLRAQRPQGVLLLLAETDLADLLRRGVAARDRAACQFLLTGHGMPWHLYAMNRVEHGEHVLQRGLFEDVVVARPGHVAAARRHDVQHLPRLLARRTSGVPSMSTW